VNTTPTEQAYTELQTAYSFFNKQLFGGQLSPCLITMQRKNRTSGYFSGNRWADRAGAVTDEIALNPMHFSARSVEDVLSTLAHEMAHLWQHHFGKSSRNGYHNQEWGAKMDAIGLCPSNTGQPGGKRTGQQMSHYIMEGGPFTVACKALLDKGLTITWTDRTREGQGGKPKTPNTRTKYTCPGCKLNAWAKPHITLSCGACQVKLEAEDAARDPD
jgi:predicted SprT family Zn-dependent metalloprotease